MLNNKTGKQEKKRTGFQQMEWKKMWKLNGQRKIEHTYF